MKISTQLISFINQHYGSAGDPASNGVDDLVQKIGAQLGAVEEVTDFGKRFEGVVIVKVVSCEDHENSDHLHVCKVDDGGKVEGVERDENGYVQVVCGAPNVRAGMLAAWLPPGATVPSTVGTNEPFVLDARALRGVVSNGMMASPKELSLGDGHEGLLEIDADYPGVAPGVLFVDAYQIRGDYIIDMENKMFTHRPDCFGYLGIAREIEGIYNRPYKSPEWYTQNPEIPGVEGEELKLEVQNEIPELVPRFTAIAIKDVKVGPSPVWLQVALARAGLRSINNIVDYTNFFMLETGQPLHAYDYDKIKGGKLGVRLTQRGDYIELLNGNKIAWPFDPKNPEDRVVTYPDIVITDGERVVGMAGVMGGAGTEVDENTKNIIIECATFDMYSIRRTSMRNGLFTDAVTRFNKGQSPLQNLAVLAKMTNEVCKFAGGKVASPLVDINHVPKDAVERGNIHAPVTVTTQFVNERLGWNLSAEEMAKLLANVEFKVTVSDRHPNELPRHPREGGDPVKKDSSSDWIPDQAGNDENAELTVTAPFWRTDIEIPEDIVEEIGRLNGYDKLPLDLPKRDLTPATKNPLLELKNEIRQTLSAAGANEMLSYTFVHGNLIDKVGQDRKQAFRVANALSPDLQYYRLSLTPSLLERVHPNIKAGYAQFALYEIGKLHNKTKSDDDGLPREMNSLALVFAAGDKSANQFAGAPYYQARKYLTQLLDHFGVAGNVHFEPLDGADLGGQAWVEQLVAPFQPNRSAVLRDGKGVVWGVVGEYLPGVLKSLKLPATTAGFEVGPFVFAGPSAQTYAQLSKYPSVVQDICLKVSADLSYADLFGFVEEHLAQNRPDQTRHTLEPVDIYQRQDDDSHKQITLRLSIASSDRTLTDQEVNALLDHVANAAKETFHAERI